MRDDAWARMWSHVAVGEEFVILAGVSTAVAWNTILRIRPDRFSRRARVCLCALIWGEEKTALSKVASFQACVASYVIKDRPVEGHFLPGLRCFIRDHPWSVHTGMYSSCSFTNFPPFLFRPSAAFFIPGNLTERSPRLAHFRRFSSRRRRRAARLWRAAQSSTTRGTDNDSLGVFSAKKISPSSTTRSKPALRFPRTFLAGAATTRHGSFGTKYKSFVPGHSAGL